MWDLVLNTEIATLKGTQARVTCFSFTKDFKTLIVGTKDGSIAFYNAQKKFSLIQVVSMSDVVSLPDQEVNTMQYLSFTAQTSFLAIGLSSGSVCVLDLSTMDACFIEKDCVPSEVTHLHYVKPRSASEGSKHG